MDSEIEQVLLGDKIYGADINQRIVRRIRLELALFRRLSVYEREQQEPRLWGIIKNTLDHDLVEDYERRHLHK